jgi:benzoate membrane transport protein
MQAIGVLRTIKMEPPVNAMTIISGIGGIVTSFFGGHNANIAGPTTALCAGPEAGKLEGRYVAAVFAGLTFIFYGVFARTMVQLISFFPKSFNHILIGLVMLPMVGRSFISAFQEGKLMFGVMAAMIVAMSNITLFKIAAPFWSLVFGCLVSLLLEWDDYKEYLKEK